MADYWSFICIALQNCLNWQTAREAAVHVHSRPPQTLTLGQDSLDAVPQDDGGSLDIHAVQQVSCFGRRHPMTAGALYEIHHL